MLRKGSPEEMRYVLRILFLSFVVATAFASGGCHRPVRQVAPPAPNETISGAVLTVTVNCSGGADTSSVDRYVGSPSNLHIGTLAVLIEKDGHRVRLIDDIRSFPSLSKTPDGKYEFKFRYEPEDRHALLGHQVQELRDVVAVGTRYGGVIDALGMSPEEAKVTHVTLDVNGRELISQDVDRSVSPPGTKLDEVSIAASSG